MKIGTNLCTKEEEKEKKELFKSLAQLNYKKNSGNLRDERNEILRKIAILNNRIQSKQLNNQQKNELISNITNISSKLAENQNKKSEKDAQVAKIAQLGEKIKNTQIPEEKAKLLNSISSLYENLKKFNSEEENLNNQLVSNQAQLSSNTKEQANFEMHKPITLNPNMDQNWYQGSTILFSLNFRD